MPRYAQWFVIVPVLAGCQPNTSTIQSLDNFAGGETFFRPNSCEGDGDSKALHSILSRSQTSASFANDVEDELRKSLSSVPESILRQFDDDEGQIIATDNPGFLCLADDAVIDRACEGDLSMVPQPSRSAVDLQGLRGCALHVSKPDGSQCTRLVIGNDAPSIRHGIVREFASLFSQIYTRQFEMEVDGKPRFVGLALEDPAILGIKRTLAELFLEDVAALGVFDHQTQLEAYKKSRQQFRDNVFKEAFDSYYCNAEADAADFVEVVKDEASSASDILTVLRETTNTRVIFEYLFPKTHTFFTITVASLWQQGHESGFLLTDDFFGETGSSSDSSGGGKTSGFVGPIKPPKEVGSEPKSFNSQHPGLTAGLILNGEAQNPITPGQVDRLRSGFSNVFRGSSTPTYDDAFYRLSNQQGYSAPHGRYPFSMSPGDHSSLPLQGWKLHVSAPEGKEGLVIDETTGLLRQRGVPHKVTEPTAYNSWVKNGSGQQGKLLTIYPTNPGNIDEVSELATEINGRLTARGLNQKSFRAVPGELELAPGIYSRYGQLSASDDLPVGFIRDQSGAIVPDQRGQIAPSWIDDRPRVNAASVVDDAPPGTFSRFVNSGPAKLVSKAGGRIIAPALTAYDYSSRVKRYESGNYQTYFGPRIDAGIETAITTVSPPHAFSEVLRDEAYGSSGGNVDLPVIDTTIDLKSSPSFDPNYTGQFQTRP